MWRLLFPFLLLLPAPLAAQESFTVVPRAAAQSRLDSLGCTLHLPEPVGLAYLREESPNRLVEMFGFTDSASSDMEDHWNAQWVLLVIVPQLSPADQQVYENSVRSQGKQLVRNLVGEAPVADFEFAELPESTAAVGQYRYRILNPAAGKQLLGKLVQAHGRTYVVFVVVPATAASPDATAVLNSFRLVSR